MELEMRNLSLLIKLLLGANQKKKEKVVAGNTLKKNRTRSLT